MPMPDRPHRRDALLAAGIFVLSLAYYLSYYNYGVNMVDEGWLVNPAMRILDGQKLYRDFEHSYGPGRFFLTAAAFKLFGANLVVERLTLSVMWAVTGVLVYFVSRRIMPAAFAAAPTLMIVVVPSQRHKVFFMISSFLVLYAFSRYVASRKTGALLLTGVMLGLAFIFRQDIGVFGLISCTAALFLMNITEGRGITDLSWVKRAGYIYLALGLTLLPVVVYFRDSLPELVDQMFLRVMGGAKEVSIPYPSLVEAFDKYGFASPGFYKTTLYYLPFVIYGLAAAVIGRRLLRKDTGLENETAMVFVALVMAVLSFNQNYWLPNYAHLLQAVPLSFVLAAYLAYALARSMRTFRQAWTASFWILYPGLFLIFNLFVNMDAMDDSVGIRRYMHTRLQSERCGFYYTEGATEINSVMDAIRKYTRKGDNILVFPQSSLLYFLTDRKNPTRYDFFINRAVKDEEMQGQMIKDIADNNVRLVVYDEVDGYLGVTRPANLYFKSYNKKVYDYIMDRYAVVETIGRYRIMYDKRYIDKNGKIRIGL